MKPDNIVRVGAMDALITALGPVDAARFIIMVKRDTFDYTEWRQKLWDGLSIEEIHAMGVKLEKAKGLSENSLPATSASTSRMP